MNSLIQSVVQSPRSVVVRDDIKTISLTKGNKDVFSHQAGLLAVGQLKESNGLSLEVVQKRFEAKEPYKPKPLDPAFITSKTQSPEHDLLKNYIAKYGISPIKTDPKILTEHLKTEYSTKLGKPTDQKSSGRCWIFSGLNVLRTPMLEKYPKDFSYSQNHIALCDKIERANLFLENCIQAKDKPASSGPFVDMIEHYYQDGGEWEMFTNIVDKYGLMPSSAMPETEYSGNSDAYMSVLKERLCKIGGLLHLKAKQGANEEYLQDLKNKALAEIKNTLESYLGKVPETFLWQGKDSKTVKKLTPQQFRTENPIVFNDMIHLVDLPYKERNVWVQSPQATNVAGGRVIRSLNVDIEVIKDAIRASIKAGEPVFMGCDVSRLQSKKKLFSIEGDLSDKILGFDESLDLSKGDRLLYHVTTFAHAMVFTGCDEKDTKRFDGDSKEAPEHLRAPLWKVENSWKDSDELFMTDAWLNEHLYEIVVHKKFLPEKLQELATSKYTSEKELSYTDPAIR